MTRHSLIVRRYGFAVLLIVVGVSVALTSCGDTLTTESMMALSGESLPASAAGTSTEMGPGVPADFSGTIEDTMPLTPAQQAGVQEAVELRKRRNPATQDPVDRGFPVNPAVSTQGNDR
jgi:hypothetical protein